MNPAPSPLEVARTFSIYINKQNRFFLNEVSNSGKTLAYDLKLKQPLSLDSIGREYIRWYLAQGYSSLTKWRDVSEVVLSQMRCVIGEEFNPATTAPVVFKGASNVVINTYKKWIPIKPPATDLKPWFEFISRMFPNEFERDTSIDWLAHAVQKPEVRPTWSLLLTSDTGTGKGYLFHNILSPIFNNQTYLCDSYEAFMGKFSAALNGTLLVLLDDPKSHSDSTMTRLKSKLTEPNQTIDEKYKAPRIQPVYSRVILASNEKRPLKLDENERRWFIPAYIQHKISRQETSDFISCFDEWVNNGGLEAIYLFLTERELTNFDPFSCRETNLLSEMKEQSESCLKGYIRSFIETRSVFKIRELKNYLKQEFDLAAADDLLSRYLAELNVVKRQMWSCDKASRSTWWAKSSILSNKEAQEFYFKENLGVNPIVIPPVHTGVNPF